MSDLPVSASTNTSGVFVPRDSWRTRIATFWKRFAQNRGAVFGFFVLLFFLFINAFADVIAPFDPFVQNRDFLLIPPLWQVGGHWPYLLGTDELGRDILSRIMYGSRYSMLIGSVVVCVSLTLGTTLGITAAYAGRWVDAVIMRIMDIVLAIPALLLALVAVAVLGPSLSNVIIAVALVQIPHFTRLARASALYEMKREYVIAARLSGQPTLLLLMVSILPNCMSPLIVQASLGFSTAVLDAAAMGFLGMGAQPPLPEWGTMLADAREFILRAWWVVTIPGLAILLIVLAFNLIGDGLRDALDPKQRSKVFR